MTDDERAIRKVVETWMTATQNGDVDTVLGLMTEDVIFMTPGQKPFGKAAFAAASRGMRGLRIDGKSDIQELQIVSNFAYLRNHIEMTITPEGRTPVRRAGYTLTIFRKEADGHWRLARDANLVDEVK